MMNNFWILDRIVLVNDVSPEGKALAFYSSPPEEYSQILSYSGKKVWIKKYIFEESAPTASMFFPSLGKKFYDNQLRKAETKLSGENQITGDRLKDIYRAIVQDDLKKYNPEETFAENINLTLKYARPSGLELNFKYLSLIKLSSLKLQESYFGADYNYSLDFETNTSLVLIIENELDDLYQKIHSIKRHFFDQGVSLTVPSNNNEIRKLFLQFFPGAK